MPVRGPGRRTASSARTASRARSSILCRTAPGHSTVNSASPVRAATASAGSRAVNASPSRASKRSAVRCPCVRETARRPVSRSVSRPSVACQAVSPPVVPPSSGSGPRPAAKARRICSSSRANCSSNTGRVTRPVRASRRPALNKASLSKHRSTMPGRYGNRAATASESGRRSSSTPSNAPSRRNGSSRRLSSSIHNGPGTSSSVGKYRAWASQGNTRPTSCIKRRSKANRSRRVRGRPPPSEADGKAWGAEYSEHGLKLLMGAGYTVFPPA